MIWENEKFRKIQIVAAVTDTRSMVRYIAKTCGILNLLVGSALEIDNIAYSFSTQSLFISCQHVCVAVQTYSSKRYFQKLEGKYLCSCLLYPSLKISLLENLIAKRHSFQYHIRKIMPQNKSDRSESRELGPCTKSQQNIS